MRDIISNLIKIFHFFTKIHLVLISIIILLIIKCEPLEINSMENNDLYLILTKDGYLRAFDKNKKIEKWKLFFSDNFIPKNINSHKLSNDIFLYPINDKFYILKKNEIISFEEFVREVNDNSKVANDYSLKAKIDYSFYLIDLKGGNIIEKIKNNKYTGKNINNDEILLKKTDYILINKENNNIINIEYSVLSLEQKNSMNTFPKENNFWIVHDLVNYFDINKIMSIYGYNFNSKIVSFLYDNSIFDKIYSNNKINKEGLVSNNNIENKENNENIFLQLINNNTVYIFLLTIITIGLIKYIPIFVINFNNTNIVNQTYNYNFYDNSNSIKTVANSNNIDLFKEAQSFTIDSSSNEEENLNSFKINNEKNIIPSNCTDLSIFNPLTSKNFSAFNLLPSEEINSIKYNTKDNCINCNNCNNCCNCCNCCNFTLEGKNKEKEKISEILEFEGEENYSDNNHKCYLLQNSQKFEKKNEKLVSETFDLGEIKEYDNLNYLISLNLKTEKVLHFIVPKNKKNEVLDLCKVFKDKNTEKILLLPDNNLKNEEKSEIIEESLYKKSNDKETSGGKIGNIWDDEDDEEDDKDDVDKNITSKNDNTIKEENNKFKIVVEKNIDCEISSNSNENLNKDCKIKEIIKSRLDKDFKNLEKIGQGGFGIVLKGIHRLDKGVCAIKIIKLKDINDKENIINEAITMTRLTSKHIVQYKTCWIDNDLGSATKFFYEEEDSESESSSLSKSGILNKNKKPMNDSNTINNDSDDDVEDNDLSLSRNKSSIIYNINNKNDNSQELAKNSRKIGLSKYCCNFRDDSHIATKSIISNRYLNESRNASENLMKGEYFFILMEYCDGLTLEKYILQNAGNVIDRKIIYSFTSQILKSLAKIHSSGIIHRDIKPCNIFIKNNQIKIGDFGLATRYPNNGKLLKSKKIEGTPLYLSPEQKNYKTYNEKVDIYACGITLYEMCSCFSTTMERYEHIMNLKNNQIISNKVSKAYPEESILIQLMTKNDYNERPSAKDILESDLFINLGKKLGFNKI